MTDRAEPKRRPAVLGMSDEERHAKYGDVAEKLREKRARRTARKLAGRQSTPPPLAQEVKSGGSKKPKRKAGSSAKGDATKGERAHDAEAPGQYLLDAALGITLYKMVRATKKERVWYEVREPANSSPGKRIRGNPPAHKYRNLQDARNEFVQILRKKGDPSFSPVSTDVTGSSSVIRVKETEGNRKALADERRRRRGSST